MKKVYLLETGYGFEAFSSKKRLLADLDNRIKVNKGKNIKYEEKTCVSFDGHEFTQKFIYDCMSTEGTYFKQSYLIRVIKVDTQYR